ncbi:DUF4238 domain-containing protein [Actinokineospora sp. 24-640]
MKAIETEGDRPVKGQHVVSKVVLKRFAAEEHRGSRWQLTPYEVTRRYEHTPLGYRGCGKVPDFLRFAAQSAEELWHTVENRLPDAIAAARTDTLDPTHIGTLKDAIALHLVRSIRYLTIHREAAAAVLTHLPPRIVAARRRELQGAFYRQYGIHSAGLETLSALLDDDIARWRNLHDRDILARVSIELMFERVRATLHGTALQVGHAPTGGRFLIGDNPCSTIAFRDGQAVTQTAIGDSHTIVLPVAPDCLVGIGPQHGGAVITEQQLAMHNTVQVRNATRFVYYSPNHPQRTFIETILDATPPAELGKPPPVGLPESARVRRKSGS